MVLNSAPAGCAGGVGVSVASGNPDVTVHPDALAFTAANWNMAQTVTVTAGQDDDGAGGLRNNHRYGDGRGRAGRAGVFPSGGPAGVTPVRVRLAAALDGRRGGLGRRPALDGGHATVGERASTNCRPAANSRLSMLPNEQLAA